MRRASDPQAALLRLAYGAQAAQVVYLAAKLGLADLVKNGPIPAEDLATSVGVDAVLLRRILRALASLGVLAEVTGERFVLTEMGQYLRSDRTDSLRPRAVFNTEVLQPLWGELLHTLRTGESGAARVLRMPMYQYFTMHPDVGALLDQVMASEAPRRMRPAVAAYDFGQFGTIVDVGGGNGALLIEILRAYHRPSGVVFDLPPVAERARENIAAAGLADRGTAIGGSALETVPGGGDAYVLSNFLVDMNDERAAEILRRCREAMAAAGKVLLLERIVPTGGEPADPDRVWDTTALDLTMLATSGAGSGRVRTTYEVRALLEAAGLTLTAIIPTTASISVIEARPYRAETG